MNPPGGGGRKLCSEILGNGRNVKRFKTTVKFKVNQNSEKFKEVLETDINQTAIKVCIKSLKALGIGRALIERITKRELETLQKDKKDICRESLETQTH